jgi:hypothetical protein
MKKAIYILFLFVFIQASAQRTIQNLFQKWQDGIRRLVEPKSKSRLLVLLFENGIKKKGAL